ncbi:inactive peptidyl-prolyl cis-trans isomerase FKBP6 isoform X2 [Heliangelus exortis]|uniref:inactive peptidyl-prolyl cis-trans isomerase FKBP6 isoform X2 n=1 Tax=Heliangelus exortis TaxID=472823 RepID=UPI003A8E0067
MSPQGWRAPGRGLKDLTGDGGVRKEELHPGTGPTVPQDASVAVNYFGFLEDKDKPFCTHLDSKSSKLMKLGTDITLWGLEIGLLTMRKGERARFFFTPSYAYGAMGCPPLLPPNTMVMFEVELLDFLDTAESDLFFDLTAALSILSRSPSNEAEQHQLSTSQLLLLLNLSITCLKLGSPAQALAYGEQALKIDQRNAKALFRCGQACRCMAEYGKALEFLVKAQHIQPFNMDINEELKKLASCYRDAVQQEKETCRRMFASLSLPPSDQK